MTSSRLLIVLVLAALGLAACSDVRESLGLGRNPPDEFTVVDRPPLSMPPDFSLRPPRPGEARPQDVNLTKQASDTLFPPAAANAPPPGTPAGAASDASATAPAAALAAAPAAAPPAPPAASDAEKALLAETGADKADPDIRQMVDQEAAQKVVGNEHLVDELLWWKKDEKPGAVVDAPAEAERIKEARDKGEPLNQGATPIIERQKSGWLDL